MIDTTENKIHIPLSFYPLIIILLGISYYNSFHASWHFDDIANIVFNDNLHLKDVSLQSIIQTFYAYPDQPEKFFRPVSNLSFGINWLIGGKDVFGYHVVNFAIHVATAIALFHCCCLLLSSISVKRMSAQKIFTIAALSSILWACNPVQTQAVTYIVQRAASLATLFYVTGIYCYLKSRLLPVCKSRYIFYALSVLCFLLALGAKENAILFPFSLILIEIIFFRQSVEITRKGLVAIICASLFLLLLTMVVAGHDFLPKLFTSYDSRDFTPIQRLFTESRIVVFYLSLLLYPSPDRLSITHDIQLSTGLLVPPTTVISIVLLLAITILSTLYYKKYPLISFAILFFLLNQLVESTIIPLELIFEHRNYLPSLFIFLPIAAGISAFIEKYRHQKPHFSLLALIFIATILFCFCLGTITRNSVWQTEKELWTDSLKKAPNTARSYINLAHSYLYKDHDYQKAFRLLLISLDKYSPTPWKDRFRAYNNMGQIMNRIGNYDKAIEFYDKALDISRKDGNEKISSWTIIEKSKSQWLNNNKEEAVRAMTELTSRFPDNTEAQVLLGEMLVKKERLYEAIKTFQNNLSLDSIKKQGLDYQKSLINIALILGRMELPEKTGFYLNLSQFLGAPDTLVNLSRLELAIRSGSNDMAESSLQKILGETTWPELLAILNKKRLISYSLPFDYPLMKTYLVNWLNQKQNKQ